MECSERIAGVWLLGLAVVAQVTALPALGATSRSLRNAPASPALGARQVANGDGFSSSHDGCRGGREFGRIDPAVDGPREAGQGRFVCRAPTAAAGVSGGTAGRLPHPVIPATQRHVACGEELACRERQSETSRTARREQVICEQACPGRSSCSDARDDEAADHAQGGWTRGSPGLPEGVRAEGADPTGAGDSSSAIQAALDRLTATGGEFVIPAGTYRLGSQLTLRAPSDRRVSVRAYGVTLVTEGHIAGLRITGGGPNGGATVYGLTVDQRGNATALAGFEVVGSWRARLVDCNVIAHGVSPSYSAIHIRNADPANDNTGSFWTSIENVAIRKRSGRSPGDIPYGVLIEGAGNATEIVGGTISDVNTGVKLRTHDGQRYLAGGVIVTRVRFEGYGTAFEAPTNVSGVRFNSNRFEDGRVIFSLPTNAGAPSVPARLSDNYVISNAGTYLNNPHRVRVNVWEPSLSPKLRGATDIAGSVTVSAPSAADDPLAVVVMGAERGIKLRRPDGTDIGELVWSGTGDDVELRASRGGSNLYVSGIKGLSGAGVKAQNLRGRAAFSGSGSQAVVFPVAERDADYLVTLGAQANETIWISGKSRAGFTLNSSNPTSRAVVEWHLIR